VRDGETGLLVELGPEPLAAAIEGLLDDPAAAMEMGRAAARRVRNCFTTAHQAAALAEMVRAAQASGSPIASRRERRAASAH
jgi:glycosyltransferase involved in cell wall biosynthesis